MAISLSVCMYVWSELSAQYRSTGFGCQTCTWPAEQGKIIFTLFLSVPENLVPPFILHTRAESGAYSRDSCRFPRRRPYIPPTAIGSVPSLSSHAIACRWCSLPRVHEPSTIGGGGDTTIPSPERSPKQLLPGIGLHDPLHGRQACTEINSVHQEVGQISPR